MDREGEHRLYARLDDIVDGVSIRFDEVNSAIAGLSEKLAANIAIMQVWGPTITGNGKPPIGERITKLEGEIDAQRIRMDVTGRISKLFLVGLGVFVSLLGIASSMFAKLAGL